MRMFIFGLALVLYVLRLSESNGFWLPEYSTNNIEIFSHSDREDSDDENSYEENSDEVNFVEEI